MRLLLAVLIPIVVVAMAIGSLGLWLGLGLAIAWIDATFGQGWAGFALLVIFVPPIIYDMRGCR